ncbi:unnamed protein product [Ceratitis capitata]|uniref:(Mediterranean fruit fly) hypothetical protein n=1 Tax=Ceratitis capitata TaxID=7213 RepID=A0A811UK66_CERCA|nr:unnamed protein product [Ceratitis capitata]
MQKTAAVKTTTNSAGAVPHKCAPGGGERSKRTGVNKCKHLLWLRIVISLSGKVPGHLSTSVSVHVEDCDAKKIKKEREMWKIVENAVKPPRTTTPERRRWWLA